MNRASSVEHREVNVYGEKRMKCDGCLAPLCLEACGYVEIQWRFLAGEVLYLTTLPTDLTLTLHVSPIMQLGHRTSSTESIHRGRSLGH